MSKHIILNAMAGAWEGEVPPGAEIWGVNRTFNLEPRLSRLYFFDDIELFKQHYFRPDLKKGVYESVDSAFPDELNALMDRGVEVIAPQAYEQIPRATLFPIDDLIKHFNGLTFFTSSVAYMVAEAIRAGATQITLNGMYKEKDSMEYMFHIYCVNMWIGIAMGLGIKVAGMDGSVVCTAMPWESNLYGYETNEMRKLSIGVLSASYEACYKYPRKFIDLHGKFIEQEDVT